MSRKDEGKDGLAEDAEFLNLSDEALKHLKGEPLSDFGIDHANWKAWQLFTDCQTQWLIGMSGVQGLNYLALHAVMDINGCKNKRRLFRQVRMIEHGALAGFNGVLLDEVIQ